MNKSSELQKMLAGELYSPLDPELIAMRLRARHLTRRFNQSNDDDQNLRFRLLQELLGRVGARIVIEPPFYCDYGSNIFVGEDVFMNFGCTILDCAEVHLGNQLLCGPHVQIYTAAHPLDAQTRALGPEMARPIRIGDRVWIGGGSIICPGVEVGSNTTIGAGSVVTRDIPSHVLAAGNPCRVIREL